MHPDPIAVLKRIRATEFVDQDGDPIVPEFGPPLGPHEIEELRSELGVPLPRELVAVLAETRSIDGIEQIDFTGRTMSVELSEISSSGLPIGADGFGNFWFLDVTPDDADAAPVFFHCHDPPVVLFQSPSMGHFLQELVRMYQPPHESAVREVHDDRVFNVWKTNPGVLDHAAALASDDELRAFATSLDEGFEFVDLRAPEIGMGFSWGRYGPRTEVRRHGYARLFAYARPEKRPGLLGRLLGGGRASGP